MSSSSSGGGGLGLGGVITVILLILKLFGVINISWLWVFVPAIAGILFWVLLIVILIIIAGK